MAQMRIAGEIITVPDKAPAPKAKRGRPAAKKSLLTLQHPINLLLNPDHMIFELALD